MVILGIGLIAGATVYKKVFSASPEGFPWNFTYLATGSIVPSADFYGAARPFINWRAFSLTFFLTHETPMSRPSFQR